MEAGTDPKLREDRPRRRLLEGGVNHERFDIMSQVDPAMHMGLHAGVEDSPWSSDGRVGPLRLRIPREPNEQTAHGEIGMPTVGATSGGHGTEAWRRNGER